MAKTIDKSNGQAVASYSVNPSSTVTIKYENGHSEVVSQDEAVNRGIMQFKTSFSPEDAAAVSASATGSKVFGGTVKPGTTTMTPGQYTTGTPVTDAFSGQSAQTNWTVPIAGKGQVPIGTLLNAVNDPKQLAAIRQGLVQNGIISKGTKSANSVIQAYTSVLVKAASVSMDPNEWMRQYKAAGGGLDVAPATPSTNISVRQYTPDVLRSTADSIYTQKVGRRISDPELKSITDQLNALEKKQGTKTVSTPSGTTTTSVTSGGVDEREFITEQAMKLPEYQRMQNMNFASWINQAMSGGQTGGLLNG